MTVSRGYFSRYFRMLQIISALILLLCGHTLAYTIEGSLSVPPDAPSDWVTHTRVHIEGGRYVGFVRPDGGFSVNAVPSGSYLVEFVNAVYQFQPVRVDIGLRGGFRARRLNPLQPNAVKILPYPLKIASTGKAIYFQQREQLRTMDLLLNPTVLFMVVPLLLVMVLPKMLDTSDPELQKEMQSMNFLNAKQNMPDMSEMLSSMFGGQSSGSSKSSRRAIQQQQNSGSYSAVGNAPSSSATSYAAAATAGSTMKKSVKKRI